MKLVTRLEIPNRGRDLLLIISTLDEHGNEQAQEVASHFACKESLLVKLYELTSAESPQAQAGSSTAEVLPTCSNEVGRLKTVDQTPNLHRLEKSKLLGKRLKQRGFKSHLSKAKSLGISPSYLSKLLRGSRRIPSQMDKKLSAMFRTPLGYWVTD